MTTDKNGQLTDNFGGVAKNLNSLTEELQPATGLSLILSNSSMFLLDDLLRYLRRCFHSLGL
jgi:hypothetical protein